MMAIQAQLYSDNFGFSLGGSQNWMDNAYFNLQQQQQQQLLNLQQKTQNRCFENNGLFSKTNNHHHHQSMSFSQSIAVQIEKERQEVDRFISLQNERLRLALQEQRNQQLALLLRKCEAKSIVLLNQKDEEIAKAMNRKTELEEFLRNMEIENETWQRLAKENEAIVESLSNTIEQLRENACLANGADDAESCCDVIDRGEREDKTGENRGLENEQENQDQRTRNLVCKSCNSRNSCVVFLPCRHLCSCNACQPFLDSCPVCGTVKKASIEALL
ncbi:putative BOI-related E3 ubiquitin-protein ligase 3 [Camellia lanceoleosa]|uniref:BOI-related E3 ubiquitin-protein ligase 3 n=1 Tax=Camellia lanceoleosa TaxID=1840588 RepID=A0ACC0IEJ3_9ERIC|nr:putative BOI-related E3 ubiquitin-protein ligase 3 [Camellia lanceoleosa]